MERSIIYVINPISGTRKKKDLQEYIEKATAAKKIPYQVFPSVASGDYSFLHPIIKENKITDVVIAGGDGTVSQVVGGLLDFNLNFGVIPCGSGNGLALTAGISKKPETALDIVFNGKPSIVDGLMINDSFSCMLCGLGFDAKVAHEFAKQPKRGLGTYASVIRKNFFSAPSYRFELHSNGIRFTTDAFFISIANSNQFGNNFTIAPKALLSDGLLDIVIVKKMAKPLLLITIMRQVLAGRIKQVENSLQQPVIYFQTKELEIKNIDMAPMHIDGDPAETPEQLKIKVLKKCFRLISPV